jgi:tRNA(fMet)-specific endonuclease VapC
VILSLDTSVLIDLLRRRDATVMRRFSDSVLAEERMMVSALVLHEIHTGLADRASDRRLVQFETLLAQCAPADFTVEDSLRSGRLRARLRARGTPIGEIDTLIAGQALARGWTVVTRNVRHFGRVEGLPLIDWAEGPDPLPPARIAERVAQED